jgi:hypothetical protein
MLEFFGGGMPVFLDAEDAEDAEVTQRTQKKTKMNTEKEYQKSILKI